MDFPQTLRDHNPSGQAAYGRAGRPGMDFTGVAVPVHEGRLPAGTLPRCRAMDAALTRAAAGR